MPLLFLPFPFTSGRVSPLVFDCCCDTGRVQNQAWRLRVVSFGMSNRREREKSPSAGAVYQNCCALGLTHTITVGSLLFLEEQSGCSLLTERAGCPSPVLTITAELFTFQKRLSSSAFSCSDKAAETLLVVLATSWLNAARRSRGNQTRFCCSDGFKRRVCLSRRMWL